MWRGHSCRENPRTRTAACCPTNASTGLEVPLMSPAEPGPAPSESFFTVSPTGKIDVQFAICFQVKPIYRFESAPSLDRRFHDAHTIHTLSDGYRSDSAGSDVGIAQDARQLPANYLANAHPRFTVPAPRGHSNSARHNANGTPESIL